jgi:hypothetical protein
VMPMLVPYVLFEFLIGPWLMIKGIPMTQRSRSALHAQGTP